MEKNIEIKEKVDKCFSCVNKNCQKGCPLGNDITEAIKFVKNDELDKAYMKFTETSVLSSICGRICPHKKQCEGKCIRGIKMESVNIGNIEAFVGDYGIDNNVAFSDLNNGNVVEKSVGIIGSGPAGITCAATLKRLGVKEVVIYEKKNYLGGLLVHGIPEFRLSKDIVKNVYDKIINLGIEVNLGVEFGKDITLDTLKARHDKLFFAPGSNVSTKLNIEGEQLNGVYGANELLEYKNYPDIVGKNICVNGGGNVAIDIARTVKKMGAKNVYIVYRRSINEMPAEELEIKEALSEGIEIKELNNVVKILGNEKVEKIECIKTELVYEEGKRPYPKEIENSNYFIETDYFIEAIGSKLEDTIINNLNVELNEYGKIKIDENYMTSDENIYCAGDAAGVKGTVAWASLSGREAAENIVTSFV